MPPRAGYLRHFSFPVPCKPSVLKYLYTGWTKKEEGPWSWQTAPFVAIEETKAPLSSSSSSVTNFLSCIVIFLFFFPLYSTFQRFLYFFPISILVLMLYSFTSFLSRCYQKIVRISSKINKIGIFSIDSMITSFFFIWNLWDKRFSWNNTLLLVLVMVEREWKKKTTTNKKKNDRRKWRQCYANIAVPLRNVFIEFFSSFKLHSTVVVNHRFDFTFRENDWIPSLANLRTIING